MNMDTQPSFDQIEDNFRQAYKGTMDRDTYDDSLKALREILENGSVVAASADFVLNSDGKSFHVTTDVPSAQEKFVGNSGTFDVSNAQGATFNGTIGTSQALFSETTTFTWFDATIMTIYFWEEDGTGLLGLFVSSASDTLTPASSNEPGTGSWHP